MNYEQIAPPAAPATPKRKRTTAPAKTRKPRTVDPVVKAIHEQQKEDRNKLRAEQKIFHESQKTV